MIKKVRIIKFTDVDGEVSYRVQDKRWFRGWKDCGEYRYVSLGGENVYETLEDAKSKLCYYDGRQPVVRVVYPETNSQPNVKRPIVDLI